MTYQALYRKWRPRTFDEIVGQDALTETLKNQVMLGRIGHAYLFCGTRGTGKTSAAKIMARAVNCPHAAEHGGNPCNACEICLGIERGSAINVFEIDAASNNGVDNIRDIREEVEYPPVTGSYKVYIIDEVHMLSAGAFNALLKTLEEPPRYVIFILATTDPEKLPATILSRCQRFDLRRIGRALIAKRLSEIVRAEGVAIDEPAVMYIAELADGSMRDALSILDRCISYRPDALSAEDVRKVVGASDMAGCSALFKRIASHDAEGAVTEFNGLIDSGAEVMRVINDMIRYLRNILLALSAPDLIEADGERLALIREDAALIDRDALIKMLSAWAELPGELRYSSAKKVLTELLIIRLSSGAAAKPAPKSEAAPAPGDKAAPPAAAPAPGAKAAPPAAAPAPGAPQPDKSDIEILTERRDELVKKLNPSNRPLFAEAVFKEEKGGIVLVFKNTMNFRLASENKSENGVLKLRALAASLLGHEIKLMARPAKPGEILSAVDRVTDEELKRIHFPVDIES